MNAICDIIAAQSEQEPTTAELYGVLGAIKQSFAEEALEMRLSKIAPLNPSRRARTTSASRTATIRRRTSDYAADAEDDIGTEFETEIASSNR